MGKHRNLACLALAIASALSLPAAAGSFQSITSESVSVEAASSGTFSANISGDAIVLEPATNYQATHRVFVTLDNGATFADAAYTLEQSLGGAGTGDLTDFVLVTPSPAGASTLEFRAASTIMSTSNYILGGSSIAGQPVNINLPVASAGSQITMSGEAQDSFGVFDSLPAITLFGYLNQISGSVTVPADGIVDVAGNSQTFTGGVDTDFITLKFDNAAVTNALTLTDEDIINITLSGDMSSISDIFLTTSVDNQFRGNFNIDQASGTATFALSASDALEVNQNSVVGVRTSAALGTIATRAFTVQADLDFETEIDKNLIASGAPAGAWTINGLQAIVSHLSLNVSGFTSWLKVVNEGTGEAQILADIVYSLADGSEGRVSGAQIGSVDAGGVFTVGEATLLAAIGNPSQLVDASITLTVGGQTDLVHITAEKKASDGRVNIPVLYNITGANARSWVQ